MSQNNTSTVDKISRAAWNLIVSSKDSTVNMLAQAVASGKIKLDPAQQTQLEGLLQQAIEAGYHRAHPTFLREINTALTLQVSSIEKPAKPAKKNS